ncbi:hypothetical protein DPMN_106409 [Dreissena polymorpha]|uniref:Uncharacterized protein n=1 Tax=Dreissena polymorpha TaxID=45954 RepID=A0A9D4K4X2_DREPO|nr:hypothetical protein DPMN_106409 [Dreissena polymorpha]
MPSSLLPMALGSFVLMGVAVLFVTTSLFVLDVAVSRKHVGTVSHVPIGARSCELGSSGGPTSFVTDWLNFLSAEFRDISSTCG